MKPRILLVVGAFLVAAVDAAATQPRSVTPESTSPPAAVVDQDARRTREKLREILQQYPPSLTQVLQLDPTLITRPDYLASYPTLASYLAQHPEVAHNPSFFLAGFRSGLRDRDDGEPARVTAFRAIEQTLAGLMFFLGFLGVVGAMVYLARATIDHRRWLHATKIQTEAHTKIVDRLSTNEDLLAYLQSPSGQRLLSLAPALPEHSRAIGAPVGRILWSMQTGIVVALGGIGLWLAQQRLIEEVAQPLHVIAMLAIAVGIGFVISAVVSYVLSRQLGLFDARTDHA
jgi:hypothetical protein